MVKETLEQCVWRGFCNLSEDCKGKGFTIEKKKIDNRTYVRIYICHSYLPSNIIKFPVKEEVVYH